MVTGMNLILLGLAFVSMAFAETVSDIGGKCFCTQLLTGIFESFERFSPVYFRISDKENLFIRIASRVLQFDWFRFAPLAKRIEIN